MNLIKYCLILCLICNYCYTQSDAIRGKVIDSDLLSIPGVEILSIDNKSITMTDLNGNFIIENARHLKSLKFKVVGAQDEFIEINRNCEYVQLIMFEDVVHCFITEKKALRIKKREQRKKNKAIPKLIWKAIEKKIFDGDKMCNPQKV